MSVNRHLAKAEPYCFSAAKTGLQFKRTIAVLNCSLDRISLLVSACPTSRHIKRVIIDVFNCVLFRITYSKTKSSMHLLNIYTSKVNLAYFQFRWHLHAAQLFLRLVSSSDRSPAQSRGGIKHTRLYSTHSVDVLLRCGTAEDGYS